MLLAVNACASAGRPGPVSQQEAWREYLGSARRAPPAAVAESVAAAPVEVWRRDLGRGIVGAPALTEDLVAVSQVDRQVALLDRATGEPLWKHRFAANLGSGPLVDYDRLYVATQTDLGEVAALGLVRGSVLWHVDLGDVAAPLAQQGERLFAAATDGWVTALSTANGARLWRQRLSGAVRAAPVAAGGALFVATADDSLYKLDAATGEVRARRGTDGAVLAAPALADSLLVFGTTTGRLEACDTATLAGRWGVRAGGGGGAGGPIVGSVAIRGDTAWAITAGGELWAVLLGAARGAHQFSTGIVARAGPTPLAAGVLIAATGGTLTLLDPATVAVRWSAKLRAPVVEPPAVRGGMVVAVSARGEIAAWK